MKLSGLCSPIVLQFQFSTKGPRNSRSHEKYINTRQRYFIRHGEVLKTCYLWGTVQWVCWHFLNVTAFGTTQHWILVKIFETLGLNTGSIDRRPLNEKKGIRQHTPSLNTSEEEKRFNSRSPLLSKCQIISFHAVIIQKQLRITFEYWFNQSYIGYNESGQHIAVAFLHFTNKRKITRR